MTKLWMFVALIGFHTIFCAPRTALLAQTAPAADAGQTDKNITPNGVVG